MEESIQTKCLECSKTITVTANRAEELAKANGYDGAEDVFHEIHHDMIALSCAECSATPGPAS